MNKTLVFLVLVFNFTFGIAQNIDRLSELEKNDFEALYFIVKSKPFIIDYLKIDKDKSTHYEEFYKLQEINKADLLSQFNSYLDKFSNAEQKSIIDSILIWKQMTELIGFPFQLQSTNLTEFHEIIANIKTTEFIINKHIYTKEQYYGSLSSSQITEVYYDLMNYLMHLNSVEKLEFCKLYFDVAYSIG